MILGGLRIRRAAAGRHVGTSTLAVATRFPAPWSVEELAECFIVRDASG